MLTTLRHTRLVGLLRYYLYRDLLLRWPRRHACNICGWRGRRFLGYDGWRAVLCPQCGSQIRHRLLAAALADHPAGRRSRIDGAAILHISPEYCLGLLVSGRAAHYVGADCRPAARRSVRT